MKKVIGLILTICVLTLSFSLSITSAATIDPVQILLVEVLSWENSSRLAFNNDVLKPLVDGDVTQTIIADAKTKWSANAQTSVVGDITWIAGETDHMEVALNSFKVADRASKQIFTTAEMINGYPDITSAGLTATGFDALKAKINLDMTGSETNDNGIKFVTLFLRELVRTNYAIVSSEDKSTVSTYNGSRIDFYLDSSIDAANKTLIVTRVNNLVKMLDNFCTDVLSHYAVDSTVKIDSITDADNYLGRFMDYTEEQINSKSGEIGNFYNYLVAQSPTEGSVPLPIIKRIYPPSSGGSSRSSSRTPTPSPTATPTPTPTATPDVTPTPTPVPPGPTAPPNFKKFIDIGEFEWAETAINYLAYKDIIRGVTEDTYEPEEGVKRGDLAMLMVRYFKLTSDSTDVFKDVSESSYYSEACRIGKANGILLGVDEENEYYEPERIITREEMMALIVRSLVTRGFIEMPVEGEGDLSAYNDQEQIEAYARPFAAFLSRNGIIIGDPNGRVRPKDSINRAEAAAIIYRLYQLNIEGLLE